TTVILCTTRCGTDANHQVKPQMVDRTEISPDRLRYVFTLREGLRWHDEKPVTSEDCVESIKRWGKRDRFDKLLIARTAKIAPVNKDTFTLDLAEPFGPVLEALGKPSSNVPFMMPARVASSSAQEQIKEVIGSGPFNLSETSGALRSRLCTKRTLTTSPPRGTERIYWRQTRKHRQGNLALRSRPLRSGGITNYRRGGMVAGTAHRLYTQAPTTS